MSAIRGEHCVLTAVQRPRQSFRLDAGRQFYLVCGGDTVLDLSDCMKHGRLRFILNNKSYASYLQQEEYGLKRGNDVLQSPVARLKRGFHRYRYECQIGGAEYQLRARYFGRGCNLFRGRNRVGSICPEKSFGGDYSINLPPEMDLVTVAFLFWLTVEMVPHDSSE